MNLNQLYYFKKLAELEHYTKASEELAITQPTLSHAILMLEKELEVPLFRKVGRNIVLTKYGKIFLKYVEESLSVLEEGIKEIKKSSTMQEGTINLGYIYTMGPRFIPKLVQKYTNAYVDRKISFSFSQGNSLEIVQGVIDETYDVGITSKISNCPDIEFIPITNQELVLVVPIDHPLANKRTIDLRDTLEYGYIYFSKSSGLRSVVDELFSKINSTPTIAYEVEEDSAILGLVANNFGIAIVPRIPLVESMNVKALTIKSPNHERLIYLAINTKIPASTLVKHFIEYVKRNAENIDI